jgi:hypothetical protein
MLHNPYSSHYQTIDNPANPFSGEIPGGLVPGKQILISGVCKGDQIKINLRTANNIALHFNPRISQKCVVRNTQVGNWGPEERDGPQPFKVGQAFEIVILVEASAYQIAVNGAHAYTYRHRLPFEEVRVLNVVGELTINRIVYSSGATFNPNMSHSPAVPFQFPIQGGPTPGRLVQLHIHIPNNAKRFTVNLQNGNGVHPNDIAFHLSVRFDDPHSGQAVVRTNRRHGGWGAEERDGGFPFAKGQNYELLILIDNAEFKLAVNGTHFTSMRHRNGLHDGNTLGVEGDVVVQSVKTF